MVNSIISHAGIDPTTTMAVQSPLVTPKHYDPMFKVDTMLHEPTLARTRTEMETAIDMMSLFTQFDVLCQREFVRCGSREIEAATASSFFTDKARVIEDQMRQTLAKVGEHGTTAIQDYMHRNNFMVLFPRAVKVLTKLSDFVLSYEHSRLDDYLTCMTRLNNTRSLAHQLLGDVSGPCTREKYLAHQLSLFHQSLKHLMPNSDEDQPYEKLEKYQKSIENNFKTVKTMLTSTTGEPLPEDLRTWVWELSSQVAEIVECLPMEITEPAALPARLLTNTAGYH